jgi:hypothetical protein
MPQKHKTGRPRLNETERYDLPLGGTSGRGPTQSLFLKARIKANVPAPKMMVEMFRVVPHKESEENYARMATRLLRFATRVNLEQAGRFGLGEDHPLLEVGAALWRTVVLWADPSAHVHSVMRVFALRTLNVQDLDTRDLAASFRGNQRLYIMLEELRLERLLLRAGCILNM